MWIRTDTNIHNHPKAILLAERMKVDSFVAGDYLIRVWSWSRQFCETGEISKYPHALIEKATRLPDGFLKAMTETGWITTEGWLKDWPLWGGAEVWQRYLKAKTDYPQYEAMFNYYNTKTQSQEIAVLRRKSHRGEKRRVDKISTNLDTSFPPSAVLDPPPDTPAPPKTKADEIVKYFMAAVKSACGVDYIPNWGADGKNAKRLLASVPAEEIKAMIDKYFLMPDSTFEGKNAKTFGRFYSGFNSIKQYSEPKKRVWKPSDPGYVEDADRG